MFELKPPPTLRDVAEHAGVSVSTVTRVLSKSPLAGAKSRSRVEAAIAELGFVQSARSPSTTISDVAAKAGVSITTVSRVMSDNGQVQPQTRTKVLQAMAELDFVANGHARALNRSGQGQVALLSASMLGPAFVGIAQGIESVVSPFGHQFVVHTTGDDATSESAHVASLREQRARAVIFLGGVTESQEYRERMARHYTLLSSINCRLVLCGRPAIAGVDTPVVDYDNAGGIRSITAALIADGHRRIAFLGGNPTQSTVIARVRGYREAMAAAGLDTAVVDTIDWETADGVAATAQLLDRGAAVTAIVAVRDQVAVGALRELRRRGIDVPGQMSVTGFDDLPLTADLTPSLTTVRTPMHEIGETVARYALASEVQTETAWLPVEVITRDSSGPAPT